MHTECGIGMGKMNLYGPDTEIEFAGDLFHGIDA
jgi:hypothetical protein